MKYFILPLVAVTIMLTSCESKKEEAVNEHSIEDSLQNGAPVTEEPSKVAVDYKGTYEGVLPCADCEGIKTTIVLNEDDTFKYSTEYIGKENKFEEDGKYSYSVNTNDLLFKFKNGETKKFLIEDGKLIQLDQEGKRVTGDLADKYILTKK